MDSEFLKYPQLFDKNNRRIFSNLVFEYLQECEWISYKYIGIEFYVWWNSKNVTISFKDDIYKNETFADYLKFIHNKFSYSNLVSHYPGIYFTAFFSYDIDSQNIYLFDLIYEGYIVGNFNTNQVIAEKLGCKKCEIYKQGTLRIVSETIIEDKTTPKGTNIIIRPTVNLYSNTHERIIAIHTI